MKRAYKKRKRRYKVNYTMLIGLIAVIVMAIICIVGLVMMLNLGGKDSDEESSSQTQQQTQTQSTEAPSQVDIKNLPDQPQDYTCFNNSAFVGDSRFAGLLNNTQLLEPDFYCEVGVNVSTICKQNVIKLEDGTKVNLATAIAQGSYDKVFIQLGINEVGWDNIDYFQQCYEEIINTIKVKQPTATVYAISIIPVTELKDAEGTYVNNVNVARFNERIKAASDKCGAVYLDATPALCGDAKVLPIGASNDGVHLNKANCWRLLNFLKVSTQ